MSFGGRLAIGAGVLAIFALVVGVAALIYGPGKTIESDKLGVVVLHAEDVPGARQAATCSGEPEQPVSPVPPIKDALQVAFLFEEGSSKASLLCLQSGAGITESRADAATAMREFQRSFLGEARLIEEFSEGKVDVEELDISRVGERSFAYLWHCVRECEGEEGGAYFLQFQRANVISVVAITGEEENPVDQLVGWARKQDDRIVAALNASD